VACLVVAVALASQYTGPSTIVYIQIAGALGVVTCISWMFLFCINANARFPDFFPVLMFVYHFVMALLSIGICVCCGMLWPQFKISVYPQFAVSTITSFIASVMFLVDAMLNLLWWRNAVPEIMTCPCSPWKYEMTI